MSNSLVNNDELVKYIHSVIAKEWFDIDEELIQAILDAETDYKEYTNREDDLDATI